MITYSFTTGILGVNTYFLVNESKGEAIIIDGGENISFIQSKIKELNVKVQALLLTHAHFDHSGNAKKIQEMGIKVYASKIDGKKLLKNQTLLEKYGKKFDCLQVDYQFVDGEILEIAGIKIKVLLTPGHTDGSATFLVENSLFTGDTLFYQSIGRTDFETGSFSDIEKSIRRLYSLEGDYTVYPGHGQKTTLEYERQNNFYVKL